LGHAKTKVVLNTTVNGKSNRKPSEMLLLANHEMQFL
jgi:hypothetical protein